MDSIQAAMAYNVSMFKKTMSLQEIPAQIMDKTMQKLQETQPAPSVPGVGQNVDVNA